MDLGVTGKCALVTGGSHGIGLTVAKALAAEGCNVAICARGEERLGKAAAELRAKGGEVIGIRADVLMPSDIDTVVTQVIATWGTVHILVNNVGGGGRWGSDKFEETEDQVWLDVYGKNAMAAVRFTRLVIPYMRRQRWGRVVTISSIHGIEGGGRPWFSMAKSAELSLMKSLAMNRDLVRSGITFNTVAPGSILVPDTGWEREKLDNPERFRQMVDRDYPMGRLGTPEEVAAVVAFVCSAQASLLNGASIVVDGSESRRY